MIFNFSSQTGLKNTSTVICLILILFQIAKVKSSNYYRPFIFIS